LMFNLALALVTACACISVLFTIKLDQSTTVLIGVIF
jgi:hypothetical protein